tara:strand:- start:17175 stop:17351 length:177 start_codon:yes stop_codon:yes gene_type:complete
LSVLASAAHLVKLEQGTSDYLLKMMGIAQFNLRNYEQAVLLLEKVVYNDKRKEQLHYF